MKYILIVFLFANINIYSQEILDYKVLSAIDSLPIQNAYISIDGFLKEVTNMSGVFKIKTNFKTVHISHLGYVPITLTKQDLNKKYLIYLKEKVEGLNEVVINNKKTNMVLLPSNELGIGLGVKKKVLLNKETMLATFIPNSFDKKCIISKIIVEVYGEMYQENTNNPFRPFKVNLYTVNKQLTKGKRVPEEQLLKKYIITSNKGNADNNYIYIDVSDFLIDFPEEGIFVVVESLDSFELENFNKPTSIPLFRRVKRKRKSLYISHEKILNWGRLTMTREDVKKDWTHFRFPIKYDFNYNFGIQVEF